jgi:cytolysin-activating lysine-acyltransferase
MAEAKTKSANKPVAASAPPKAPANPVPAAAQPKAAAAPETRTLNNARPAETLGAVIGLLLQSPSHRHVFLSDLEWLVVPPLVLRQFALFRRGEQTLGYASWALVNEEVEKRLLSGNVRLAPKEWRSGDRVWLVDLVAPANVAEPFLAELRGRVLAGREVKVLRPGPGGKPTVETWPAGAPAEKQKDK